MSTRKPDLRKNRKRIWKYKRRELTQVEKLTVERVKSEDKARWEYLLSLNKWKPQNEKSV